MKNLSLILSIVLLVAVAVLYVLHFSVGSQISEHQDTVKESLDSFEMPVAYVNTDTVLSKYELFKKMSKDLEEKQKKAEQNLKSRADGFQREVQEFQSTVNNLTINQAKALEESLRQKQQNLMVYEQTLTQQLMQESNEMNEQLYVKLSEFLEKYGKENELKLVVAYTNRGDVLYANDALDITDIVIEGLNKEYSESLETEVKE